MKKRTVFTLALALVILLSITVFGDTKVMNSAKDRFQSTHAEFFYALGNQLYNDGEQDRAMAVYEQALDLEPGNEHVLNNMGMYYAAKGEYQKAEQFFLEAIEMDQYYVIARSNLAIVYHDMGRYDEAIQQLIVLKKIEPENPSHVYDLGINIADLYRTQGIGNLNEAISYFEQADNLEPGFLKSKENIIALKEVLAEEANTHS
ncbi:MAG: tetratricopeptide repeat protein [Nanoarchaeota archaeon]|nr:tetratricopeptide repeat protein [Nanoarchaeota archaeon]